MNNVDKQKKREKEVLNIYYKQIFETQTILNAHKRRKSKNVPVEKFPIVHASIFYELYIIFMARMNF